MRTSALLGIAALAAMVAGAAITRAADAETQGRSPTFPARLDMVSLVVSVTDAHGRPVAGLAQKAFTVLEDGTPQDLCLFANQPIALSLAIVIDTSGSMERTLPIAQAAATNLLEPLHDGDEAMVAQFNQRYQVMQEFTGNLPALAGALRALRANGATGLYDALYCTLKDLSGHGRAGEVRRRALVLLSDGEDTGSLGTEEQALGLAREAGVVIYTIGLRSERGAPREASSTRAAHFLAVLARETGGRAYFTSRLSDLDGMYASIADELRTQYTLGYIPKNARNDGGWRRIAVMTNPQNLVLRYRLGYFALRERTQVGSR
jgi:Ca-activated chloride channel family protein